MCNILQGLITDALFYLHISLIGCIKELQTLTQLLFFSGAAGRPVLLLQDLCLHRPERRLCAGQTQRCVPVQAGIPRGHFESITEA